MNLRCSGLDLDTHLKPDASQHVYQRIDRKLVDFAAHYGRNARLVNAEKFSCLLLCQALFLVE